jgi:hypothetical protein
MIQQGQDPRFALKLRLSFGATAKGFEKKLDCDDSGHFEPVA